MLQQVERALEPPRARRVKRQRGLQLVQLRRQLAQPPLQLPRRRRLRFLRALASRHGTATPDGKR